MGHLSHSFGKLQVVTSPLEARPGHYISCVMRDGLPWDAEITSSPEEAALAHRKFCVMSSLFTPVIEQNEVVVNMHRDGMLN